MGMESKFIWMNGEMVPFEKATLHFLTPALHYGAAVDNRAGRRSGQADREGQWFQGLLYSSAFVSGWRRLESECGLW